MADSPSQHQLQLMCHLYASGGLTRRRFLAWALLTGAAGLAFKPREVAGPVFGVKPAQVRLLRGKAEKAAAEADPASVRAPDVTVPGGGDFDPLAAVHAMVELFSSDPLRDRDALLVILGEQLGVKRERKPAPQSRPRRGRAAARIRSAVDRARSTPRLPSDVWLAAQPPLPHRGLTPEEIHGGQEAVRDLDRVAAALATGDQRWFEVTEAGRRWIWSVADAMSREDTSPHPELEATVLEVAARSGRNAVDMGVEYLARRTTALVGRAHPAAVAAWASAAIVLNDHGYQTYAAAALRRNLAIIPTVMAAEDRRANLIADAYLHLADAAQNDVRTRPAPIRRINEARRALDAAGDAIASHPAAAGYHGVWLRRTAQLDLLSHQTAVGQRMVRLPPRLVDRLDEGRAFNLLHTGGSWPMGWLLEEARIATAGRETERVEDALRRFGELWAAEPAYPNYPAHYGRILRAAVRDAAVRLDDLPSQRNLLYGPATRNGAGS